MRKRLRVFEAVLTTLDDRTKDAFVKDEQAERTLVVLKRFLERDGFRHADGKLTSIAHNPGVEELSDAAHGLNGHVLRQQSETGPSTVNTKAMSSPLGHTGAIE